ncbi:hypothetical protein B9Z55_020582 [Caenorhabditis nigoni]|uniref:Apple domain-containing protein n=1 Tax=Caenorhabditis nigoni TaxID=1611254 RepID=A0A2G5TNA9_9PELO|nr:hypothetical protein B9Z55_020582 [Caenorhabditis nigoni]
MFHFHILLLVLYLGSTEASCRARPPGLDQNLTTVGPIIDDPQLSTTTEGSTILTTTVPEGNHTCLIPYLYNTEFDAYNIAKDVILPFDKCFDLCFNEKKCVALDYRKDKSQCRTFNIIQSTALIFRIKPCNSYYVTVYVKLILPTSEPCTQLNLYSAMEDIKTWSLEGGEKYQFYGDGPNGKIVQGA